MRGAKGQKKKDGEAAADAKVDQVDEEEKKRKEAEQLKLQEASKRRDMAP